MAAPAAAEPPPHPPIVPFYNFGEAAKLLWYTMPSLVNRCSSGSCLASRRRNV